MTHIAINAEFKHNILIKCSLLITVLAVISFIYLSVQYWGMK